MLNNLNMELKALEKEGKGLNKNQLMEDYARIVRIEKEIASYKSELKTLIMDSEFKNDFLTTRTNYKFKISKKNLQKLPIEFLKLDNSAISSVYHSSIGNSSWLKQYGLSVIKTDVLSFKNNLRKEEKE